MMIILKLFGYNKHSTNAPSLSRTKDARVSHPSHIALQTGARFDFLFLLFLILLPLFGMTCVLSASKNLKTHTHSFSIHKPNRKQNRIQRKANRPHDNIELPSNRASHRIEPATVISRCAFCFSLALYLAFSASRN